MIRSYQFVHEMSTNVLSFGLNVQYNDDEVETAGPKNIDLDA